MNTALTVSVEDAKGRPVLGATVKLVYRSPKQTVQLKQAKAPGQYIASNLETGQCTLQVKKRGYLQQGVDIELLPGRNAVQAVMGKKGQPYYYSNKKKVYFEQAQDQILLHVRGRNAATETTKLLRKQKLKIQPAYRHIHEEQKEKDICFECVSLPARRMTPANTRRINRIVKQLESKNLKVVPALVIKRGEVIQGLTNELVVKFDDEVSKTRVAKIAREFGLKIKRPILTSGNAYVLTSGELPSYQLLKIAERLKDKYSAVFVEPELLTELETDQYTPNDQLFNLLNHLPLVNCDDAWETLGEFHEELRGGLPSVCLAVFDPHGVTPNHPDLSANLSDGRGKMVTTFNFRNMSTQTVAALGGDHGTQCAGSATAAFDNNIGTAGVAPNCRLIGARLPNPATGTEMADAFLWAAGINNGSTDPNFPAFPAQTADVISNSWGSTGTALSAALQNAFDRLTDEGRDGKGVVITFSTGNLGYVQFSNQRTYAAYNRTIAVGASINTNPTSPVNSSQADPNGNTNNLAVTTDTRTLYNPFGPEMDIVAPSHTCYAAGTGNLVDPTTSTVRVGTGALDGCSGAAVCNDYATSFGGTSHSSPTIAGSVALILAANPLLTWKEVIDILRRTAVRIDAGNTNAIGQYVDNDGDGVTEFSQWYGYGRVDVEAAVREALLYYVAHYNLRVN